VQLRSGSISNVVGLPMESLLRALNEFQFHNRRSV